MNGGSSDSLQIGQADTSPNGPAWAALLAGAIGGVAFGVVTDIAECSARASKALTWYPPAGNLAGVAISAIALWLAAWAALHARWKEKNLRHELALMAVMLILILAALVATFPPFYELFPKSG